MAGRLNRPFFYRPDAAGVGARRRRRSTVRAAEAEPLYPIQPSLDTPHVPAAFPLTNSITADHTTGSVALSPRAPRRSNATARPDDADAFGRRFVSEAGGVSALRSLAVATVLLVALCGSVPTAAAQESDQNVQVSATTTESTPIAGETTVVETTVSNLESSDGAVDIDSIRVRDRDTLDIVSRVDDVSTVDPGGSVTVPVPTTFAEPGDRMLSVVVYIEDDDGPGIDRYEQLVYVEVEEPAVRAELDATVADDQFGRTSVEVRNVGNVNLTDVTLAAAADEEFERVRLDDIGAGENRSVTVDTRSASESTVTFTAGYTALDERHTATETVDLGEEERVLGAIELTSVDSARTATGVQLEGDAANVGGTNVSSVTVRVQNTSSVTPVPPSADFFVGSVDASEFATFELTAETAPNASVVPVEITYIAENERTTRTQTLEIGSTPAASGGDAGGGADGSAAATTDESGGLILPGIGVAVVVLVVGSGVYLWGRK